MIGIIGAMSIEVERLRSKLEDPVTKTVSGVEFVSGRLNGTEVVTAKCGIGKVASATCTEAMILCYHPELIINTGVAGSLSPELNVGDIAVADRLVEHDMDTTPLGDEPGYLHHLGKVFMEADPNAAQKAAQSAKALGLNCRVGVIASGDQFIADAKKKERIVSLFGGIACEMEGAAIAHVCTANSVPFAVIRAISDSADGSAGMTYEEFLPKAAENAAAMIEDLVKA